MTLRHLARPLLVLLLLAAIGAGLLRVVEIRTVFKDLPAGVKNEGNIAVVVGNQDYLGDLPDNPDGRADADAVMALLVDQLGYKQENIIDLRDTTLSDFERVFGSDSNPEGELAKRIDVTARKACRTQPTTGTRIESKNGLDACMADVRRQVETRLATRGNRTSLGR